MRKLPPAEGMDAFLSDFRESAVPDDLSSLLNTGALPRKK